jgi:catalase
LLVAEITPALIDTLLGDIDPCFPEHVPGTRQFHSKGIGVAGFFRAAHSAEKYCIAPQFDGSAVPVTVRFSNSSGQLDPDGRLQNRGMAVKFYVGGTREPNRLLPHTDANTIETIGRVEDRPVVPQAGRTIEETDLISISLPVFIAENAERTHEFLTSYRARKVRRNSFINRVKSLLTMCPLPPHEAGVTMSGNEGVTQWSRHNPAAQAFVLENGGQRLPASYARVVYYAVHAFDVEDPTGAHRLVRFSFEPSAGVRAEGPGDPLQSVIAGALRPIPQNTYGLRLDSDYLQNELRERLNYAPVRFNLRMQIADPRDPTDATCIWPFNRRRVLMGTITLTHVLEEQHKNCEALSFNPGRLLHGMQPSQDQVLHARIAAYDEAYRRRVAAHESRTSTPGSMSDGCPFGLP